MFCKCLQVFHLQSGQLSASLKLSQVCRSPGEEIGIHEHTVDDKTCVKEHGLDSAAMTAWQQHHADTPTVELADLGQGGDERTHSAERARSAPFKD